MSDTKSLTNDVSITNETPKNTAILCYYYSLISLSVMISFVVVLLMSVIPSWIMYISVVVLFFSIISFLAGLSCVVDYLKEK